MVIHTSHCAFTVLKFVFCGINFCSSFLSDINCGEEAAFDDLSSLYEMLEQTPKVTASEATPLQTASVRRRRSIGRLHVYYVLFIC